MKITEFISLINDLFGSWRQRAEEVAKALRQDNVAYVLVTTPDPSSIREVLAFAERLKEKGLRPAAVVVNRVHSPLEAEKFPGDEEIREAFRSHRLDASMGHRATERIRRVVEVQQGLARRDAENLRALREGLNGMNAPLIVTVPAFPAPVDNLTNLGLLAELLSPQ